MQYFPTAECNVTAWRHSRLLAHWHMVKILNRGSMPCKRTGRKWCKSSRSQCATSQLISLFCLWKECVRLWAELNGGKNSLHCKANMLSPFSIWLCAHWLMAPVGGGGGGGGGSEGEVCILRSPWIAASPISLLSMKGVCGRSLTL